MAQSKRTKISVVKLKPELHRALRIRAIEKSTTLSEMVDDILGRFMASEARKRQKQQEVAA